MAQAATRLSRRGLAAAVLLLGSFLILWRLFSDDLYPRHWRVTTITVTSLIRTGTKEGAGSATPTGPSKAIIIGALASEDTSWVEKELPDWERVIYVVDAQEAGVATASQVPQNKGNEANAYLWYIIQHYEDLPEVLVFLHSHRDGKGNAWHVDNEEHSNPLSIQQLRLDTVLREGFVNLRCIQIPGCPEGLHLDWNATAMPKEYRTVHAMPFALPALFPMGMGKTGMGNDLVLYPDVIAAPCCAQFATSREQVRQRPRSDYERYHRWLMATDLDNRTSGRVLEFLWHIIFGKEAVWCPQKDECRCKTYGQECKT